jgi:very-short-patch-repair endonuclease
LVIGTDVSEDSVKLFLDLKNARTKGKVPRDGHQMKPRVKKPGRNPYMGVEASSMKWVKKTRSQLLHKDNAAEKRMRDLLKKCPVAVHRERPISVDGKLFFIDFLITSIVSPKRFKCRVAIEIDGAHHFDEERFKADRERERMLLSTCRVRSIIRMGWDVAFMLQQNEIMTLIREAEDGCVRFVTKDQVLKMRNP